MAKDWKSFTPNQSDRDEMASDLHKKADWHKRNAGSGKSASLEGAAQHVYRAELAREGVPHPDLPKVRHMGGRAVEPESKPRSSRPDPKEFAFR